MKKIHHSYRRTAFWGACEDANGVINVLHLWVSKTKGQKHHDDCVLHGSISDGTSAVQTFELVNAHNAAERKYSTRASKSFQWPYYLDPFGVPVFDAATSFDRTYQPRKSHHTERPT